MLSAGPAPSATALRLVHGAPPSSTARELKGAVVFLAKNTSVYGKGHDMTWPVKQQLFLKTLCRRAAGLQENRCQALAWIKPLGKGRSLVSLRTSVRDKNKLKGWSCPKQQANWNFLLY